MTARERRNRTAPLAPGPAQSRPRPDGAESVGTAQPRPGAGGETIGSTPQPPDAGRNASAAADAARAASLRQRRRGAGATLLTGLPAGEAGAARLARRTLVGN